MKSTIVNILIMILMFNVIMIIFPEGRTQKFCRISIKIFIMIYVLNNIFLNGGIDLKMLENMPSVSSYYEREAIIKSVDQEFIDELNKNNYDGEEVIKNIELSFTESMYVKVKITLNKLLSIDEVNELKRDIAEIFQISSDNIDIISGGIYE
ncbi:MAG: hypothetical protein SA378_09340 [Sedimentibacter sp.]|uniref:hypothetical protein n=1 Tax=Sedimentibacter sp. TaxID=1960295 RepID=UPI0029820F99|nr:hypothetical protein [Sedimentibacter sp.]MDW5300327.1 hypothetical protein [Sedimentibacter sp.]